MHTSNKSMIENIPSLKLRFSSKNLLIKLIALMGDNDSMDLFYDDLAELIGASAKTIQRAKKQLVEFDFIEVKFNGGSVGKLGRTATTFTLKRHFIKAAIDDRMTYLPKPNDV